MKLKSLLVNGFKSFPDARVDFPQGITAVVGPNGVGKSNVVDAVLWVLGEQSTKALRSERMEDVIFNGTESRKPLGMAEVSLVVSDVTNKELESVAGVMDALPGNKELMVTRRLYRDGESEYSINKIPCRLKDIRHLFLEARAGTKGHTVIEQGNMDQLLSGSPQDRRQFIEETAGIGRFQRQKIESLRKLKATEENLLRVRDIIAEVKKQRRTLDRQAREVEHYRRLQAECRAFEIQLLRHEWKGLHQEQTRVQSDLTQLALKESKLMAEEARLTASREEARVTLLRDGELVGRTQEELRLVEHGMAQALTSVEVERHRADLLAQQRTQTLEERTRLVEASDQAGTTMEELRARAQRSEEEIARVTGQLRVLETQEHTLGQRRTSLQTQTDRTRQDVFDLAVERSHVESQLANLETKKEDLLSRIQELDADRIRRRQQRRETEGTVAEKKALLGRIVQDVESGRGRRETTSSALTDVEGRLREAEEHQVQARTDRAAAESRRQALQSILQEEFGYRAGGEGAQSSLRNVCQGVKEALAERLEVPQAYEVAIEAVLGEHIRAWVVQGVETIPQALAFLKEQDLGRGTFVTAQPQAASSKRAPEAWTTLQKKEGIVGRAVDLITPPEDRKELWDRLLGRVVVVESLHDGLALIQDVSCDDLGALLLVTRNGEVIDPGGIVTGGSSGDASGLLQRRREVRSLERTMASIDERMADSERQREALQKRVSDQKLELHALEASLKESEMQQLIVEKELSTLERTLEDVDEREQARQADHQRCQDELAGVGEHRGAAQIRLDEMTQEQGERERQLESLTAQMREVEKDAEASSRQLTETRLTLATSRERSDRARADVGRLQEEDRARTERLQRLAEKIAVIETQTRQSQEEQQRADSVFREFEAKQTTLQSQLATAEERHAAGLQRTQNDERQLADNRKHFTSTRDTRAAADVQLAEIRTRMSTMEDTLTLTYGESVEKGMDDVLKTEGDHDAGDGGQTPQDWRDRIEVIRGRMDRMGPLNLAAVEEHRELEERYQFLSKQEEDLSESIRSLQEIIERLNRTTGRMFKETFEALQEKFGEVFSALFAGGRAELVLVKPNSEEDGEDAGKDPGIDVVAQPPGKRLKNLTMLSGGEKTLTVLALLFASFLIKPSPFCILDEVDAPLDEPNVIRFAQFLTQLTPLSQFLVITHNKRTMEVADSLFGVTMEEPGVSKFVSVKVSEFENA